MDSIFFILLCFCILVLLFPQFIPIFRVCGCVFLSLLIAYSIFFDLVIDE